MRNLVPARPPLPVLLLLACLPACRQGGGPTQTSNSAQSLRLLGTSIVGGGTMRLNQPLELRFDRPIEFATVSDDTVRFRALDGRPAIGTYSFARRDTDGDGVPDTADENTLRFQPRCPLEPGFADGGLAPAGTLYTLEIRGRNEEGLPTLVARDGTSLTESFTTTVVTPTSTERSAALFDARVGPPQPVVRARGTQTQSASRFELGDGTTVFVELDPATGSFGLSDGAPDLPRNLFTDPTTRVAFLLHLDQPIHASETNLARLRFEYEPLAGDWIALDTERTVLENCEGPAIVALQPVGLLPSGRPLRIRILPGFEDVVGDALLVGRSDFAPATSAVSDLTSLADPEAVADAVFEDFSFGGPASLEDTSLWPGVRATWGNGVLRANTDSPCTGGPGGDFDWIVRAGQTLVFDTTATAVVGGPDGVPTAVQNTVGGLVQVRRLTVEAGATLRVLGPNRFEVCATGDVRIDGRIDLSGFQARDVATLNTGHQPESGGAGGPAGGRGGTASEKTTASTTRGGAGQGPYGSAGTGGQGGESGFADASLGKDARRPGGGGGGRFARDFDPAAQGLFAGAGFPGYPDGRGAESGLSPARGGAAGIGPFVDGDDDNDFLGTRALEENGKLVALLRGELERPAGGHGGGGGGDAIPSATFPPDRTWTPAQDEKGGGGGGGGGAGLVRTLGRVTFGPAGRIVANGGQGATGENTLFLDHVGGTGGSGSGGLIVIEAVRGVDFTGGDPSSERVRRALVARGGASRVGSKDFGAPCGISHGGSGGPGLIEVLVPFEGPTPTADPAGALVLPASALLTRDPVREVSEPSFVTLLPTFDVRSTARSKWIPLGAPGVRSSSEARGSFSFDGVDPETGEVVPAPDGVIRPPAALAAFPLSHPRVTLEPDERTLVLGDPILEPLREEGLDLYLRTPALLEHATVSASRPAGLGPNPTSERGVDFEVVAAAYDDGARSLRLTLENADTTLAALAAASGGELFLELRPAFFRLATGGVADLLEGNRVLVRFQAAGADAQGRPDEANPLVDWSGDASAFDGLGPGPLFLRFEVEFRDAAIGLGEDPRTTILDFLRLPFRF